MARDLVEDSLGTLRNEIARKCQTRRLSLSDIDARCCKLPRWVWRIIKKTYDWREFVRMTYDKGCASVCVCVCVCRS